MHIKYSHCHNKQALTSYTNMCKSYRIQQIRVVNKVLEKSGVQILFFNDVIGMIDLFCMYLL